MGKFKYPLGILFTMIIGALLNMFLCCNCWGNDDMDDTSNKVPDSNASQQVTSAVASLSTIKNLMLRDENGALIEEGTDHLNFMRNDYKHLEPISTAAISSYGNIKSYLDNHPDKKLNITGLYGSDEMNNSAFTNLGEARANDVKNYLASLGYDTTHMGINGELTDDLNIKEDIIYGPVNYRLSDLPSGDNAAAINKELDDLAADLKANPLVLQFATGASTISLTSMQREKISKLVRYLDARPQSSLVSVGHTDDTGSRVTNIAISAKRAEFAKSYLVNNGITASRIAASGKGPDEPIASNNTEEGKSQNRRVVVTLK